jgi:spermidine/putrescine transport system substrate-binding protein
MNFAYRPEVQADITEYVNYVTPVAGVQEIIAKRDPELGKDPLIFPTPDQLEGCSGDPDPPGNEQDVQEVTEAFQDVITG